jgi:hypothetical protein
MIQILEAQTHPLTKVISRFIQLHIPLLPLKLMVQSRCGVTHLLEAETHPAYPLTKAILRFIQLQLPLPPLKPMGHLILVGAPIVLNPPTKAADL